MRMTFAAVLVFSLQPLLVASATITVDGGGAGDHPSIQAALDAAADGDTVLVRAGEHGLVAGRVVLVADGRFTCPADTEDPQELFDRIVGANVYGYPIDTMYLGPQAGSD